MAATDTGSRGNDGFDPHGGRRPGRRRRTAPPVPRGSVIRRGLPGSGFRGDRRGGVTVWFGLAATALLFFAGSGLDLARSINQQVQIQGAADAAALAGAGAYTGAATLSTATAVAANYMNQFKTGSGLSTLTFTVTPGTLTSGGSVTGYRMTVAATASISNTLMTMARKSNTMTATATAQNPVYNATISLSNFSSSALDTDTISYYIVPADGSTPATTLLYSNIGTATPYPTTVPVTASQKIGFMLVNTTDGRAPSSCTLLQVLLAGCSTSGYGNNSYGGAPRSVHYFYSHVSPPGKLAYPSVAQNCSLQVLTSGTASPASGSCLNALPGYATVSCVQASGMTLYFYWNDMGGSTDDKDYNDVAYTVTCPKVDGTVAKGLVLTD